MYTDEAHTDASQHEINSMSAKLTCKAKDAETGICTFDYTCDSRVITFYAEFEELETWWKGCKTIDEMTDAPFKTGPGIFDHPVISFALFSLVMMIGGNEDLVGAEYNVTAPKKVQA